MTHTPPQRCHDLIPVSCEWHVRWTRIIKVTDGTEVADPLTYRSEYPGGPTAITMCKRETETSESE